MSIPSKSRRWGAVALMLFQAGLPGQGRAAVAGASADFEDLSRLERLADTEAAQHLPVLTQHERLVAGPINPAVKLARCSVPVRPSVSPGGQMRDRVLVQLRCSGTLAWHLYVPVRMVGTSRVAIAAHAIVAGAVLAADDIRIEQRDISQLPGGYMDDPAGAVGLTASRPISSGSVITNQLLLGAKAVQRGQTVTLEADAGGVSISMEGRALADALVNQRVKVENLSSGKIVEGIARSRQVVEIILQ